MQVETYEHSELLDNATIEDMSSPEALALIEKLELVGQRELTQFRSSEDEALIQVRNPYPRMTMEEDAIYRTLLPRRTNLSAYNASAIPLRVLQVAAHAEPLFSSLDVWHPEIVTSDPLLVGTEGLRWDGKVYMLARWGDTLDSLDQLRVRAKKILMARYGSVLAKAQIELQSALLRKENIVDLYLMGEKADMPYINLDVAARLI